MSFAVALTGPTASGKTALSIALCHALAGEVICLDSMQLYRHMDIGTAKIRPEETEGVPHHLFDILSPRESFSAADYRARALPMAEQILSKGHTPLFVGGTGLYLASLLRDPTDTPPSDEAYRRRGEQAAATEEGKEALYARLLSVDPESAALIHKNNVRRVIRALEIYDTTGKKKSDWDKESLAYTPPFPIRHLTLAVHDRALLYRRIEARVDQMMKEGLYEEVRCLYEAGLLSPESTAGQAIGYKELAAALRGECTVEEAVAQVVLSSRRYAKRQLTWFRAMEGAYPLYIDDENGALRKTEELTEQALAYLREQG